MGSKDRRQKKTLSIMPGHVKLGKAGEPDPDPLPYLVCDMETKRADQNIEYDPKNMYWCPDGKHGYMKCMVVSNDGTKAEVMCGHEKKVFKTSEIGQVNPPKFEKIEDMADLTYLNDASVFHNLDARFKAKLIYTSSGLFCIVVNPYKRYPIYTATCVKLYLGKRRNEVPPHLWAITETAYRNMLTNTKNQSMLITGESGAGKTENTKKVIAYLAAVAVPPKKKGADDKKVSLEDQIVATNPILESYGNAKTSRNDNSSRFGKFIRIHFNGAGKLAGCDIESYLLEKSRITQQQEVERSYHIFYQLLQPHVPALKDKCLVTDDIYDYSYVSQGKVTVASIDDNEELQMTDEAFDIIGFSQEEKWDCYKLTAAIMACGEVKFVQKGRDDQAEMGDVNFPKKVAELYGCDFNELFKAFCKPKIKVGTEWVTKGQTLDQAHTGVGGIARATFDRIFKWLIIKCNDTLIDKAMGESNFPKATDKTYEDKVKAQHLGKSPSMAKAKSATDPNAHFAIIHYAGTVSYNVTGWLDKNKDPVNDTVVDILKRSSCELMVTLWMDHPGQSAPPDKEKKKKKGGGKTVASVYLVQLAELMATLNITEPHFIRCIVPNTHKKPLETETPLIMHQLTCNGVLEGIRVCMLGFPNRMLYRDYKARYQVLGAEILATAGNDKDGVYALMDKIAFEREKFRCGHTMVFFRAGALAALEEARDGIVLKLVRWMQGQAFGRIRRVAYQKKADQRELMKVIQRNFRKYMILRSWGWFVIIQKTKPLVGQRNPEQELAELEELATAKYGAYEDALKTKARLQEENVAAKEEIQALIKQIEAEQGNMSQYTDRQAAATAEKTRLEGVLVETGNLLVQMQQSREDATGEKKELEAENMVIKKDIEDLELAIQKLEQEKTNRDHNIRSLNDEIANQDEVINKLNKEKKHVAENNSKASEDLQSAEDKVSHLNNVKSKLESTFDELEDSLNKEKRARADIEKKRRKIEGDLKVAQDSLASIERSKKDMENTISRKEKDFSGLANRLDEQQGL